MCLLLEIFCLRADVVGFLIWLKTQTESGLSDPLSDSLALGAIGDIVDEMKSCSKSQDTRDWCSQINGALSIGVSSTGLSTGGSVAPSFSAASDETNSYYGRGDGDYQVKNYLKDLEAFKNPFHEPLSIAKECVSQVDDDLMTTFKLTELQAGELIVLSLLDCLNQWRMLVAIWR
eukprot:g9052.t1